MDPTRREPGGLHDCLGQWRIQSSKIPLCWDLARDTIVPLWGLQDRPEDVITPKSLTESVGYRVMPMDVKYEKSSLIYVEVRTVLKED